MGEIIFALGIQPPPILDVDRIISGDQVIREIKHQVKTILVIQWLWELN